ncbi:hypothetical protein EXIGLDRAFT_766995 [Exidia glandulosa HHB12029]|uniref:F-box domain-containing protein n=1 Tax=Exidia glandulosa HHB12029 TaxID=1314781 RepID=A0A165JAR3_EXIGL|nr:hypothetical protein EXIGLDRAFT_766995 [Exidia glandulosa HHB12029]
MNRLPDELKIKVFDLFSLSELCSAAAVCRQWRTIAFDLPTYWRTLELTHNSDDAVQFFISRLNASRDRPVNVSVHFSALGRLPDVVFDALARHIVHIRFLFLRISISHWNKLAHALSRPALELEALVIALSDYSDDHRAFELPVLGHVQCEAPNLTSLTLENVSLPLQPLHWCAGVRRLYLAYDEPVEPPDIFALFPRVRELVLGGRISLHHLGHNAGWESVERLCLVGFFERNWLQWEIPARIPKISTIGTSYATVTAYAAHLEGPLELSVLTVDGDKDAFTARWRSTASDRVREALYMRSCNLPREYDPVARRATPLPCDVLSHIALSDRLVHLEIPGSWWSKIVPHMVPLPALTDLTITLSTDDGMWPFAVSGPLASHRRPQLHCPSLQKFTLTASRSQSIPLVELEDLRDFIIHALPGHPVPLSTCLVGLDCTFPFADGLIMAYA